MHVGDPESPRASPAAEISYPEIDRILRDFAADDPYNERGAVGPVARREELLTRSGLLLPRPGDRAAFYHLSVQEFLAAERILRTEDDLVPVFRARGAVAGWRPTLLFLFAGKIGAKMPRWGTDLLARLIAELDRATVRANPGPAAFIAEALDLCLAKNYTVPAELKEAFRGVALNAIKDEVELPARYALGLTLAGWVIRGSSISALRRAMSFCRPMSTCRREPIPSAKRAGRSRSGSRSGSAAIR
jgi:hypothetical protein